MRIPTLLAATMTAIGVVILGVVAGAQAAPPPGTLGTLTMNPATGSDIIAPTVTTSAGCTTDSTAYTAVVTGPGAFAAGFLITSFSSAGFSTTAPFTIVFGVSMKDAATDLGTTIVPGEYPVTANCVDDFSNVKGTFTMSMYFTSPTAYQTTDPSGAVPTTTTLAATPTPPLSQGASVTLTATVTPATAPGTVQFKNGTANLGSPVTVAGGTATLTTTQLPVGVNPLTAVFTGATPDVGSSTSAAVSCEVRAATTTTTTTTTETTTTTTDSTTTDPTTETTTTTDPVDTTPVSASTAGLASTGVSVGWLFTAGLALVVLGTVYLLATRRRRA